MTIRELCEKEVVQLEQGVCLGRADDLELDPATAQLQSLILLGRPRLFGLLGRDVVVQCHHKVGSVLGHVHVHIPVAGQQFRLAVGQVGAHNVGQDAVCHSLVELVQTAG